MSTTKRAPMVLEHDAETVSLTLVAEKPDAEACAHIRNENARPVILAAGWHGDRVILRMACVRRECVCAFMDKTVQGADQWRAVMGVTKQ